LTAAIRPSGIFGEADSTILPNLIDAYRSGKTKFQVGDNTNLFDFTYVGNVADAHILTVDVLLQTHAMSTAPLDTEKVDGEAFFITNDQPTYFWDFSRAVWKEAGDTTPIEKVWKLNPALLLPLAALVEWIFWLLRLGVPNLTQQKLSASTMTRYYNIDKAKSRLGYRPKVSIQEAIKRSVKPIVKAKEEAEQRAKEKKSQ
jgi:sterol-4alpha-carboxylate 3-dehydrogenase (decarboxylating)